MTHDLVHIRNLRVELGGNRILARRQRRPRRGRITALIGLNGSGKTTLLRALLKEVPYTGRVEFHCGHDHRRPDAAARRLRPAEAEHRRPPAADRARPAGPGLAAPAAVPRHQPPRANSQHGRHARPASWRPAELLDRPVEKISGGELQRVLLALALEPNPELLLLDEPAAGIDFQDQEKFYDLISPPQPRDRRDGAAGVARPERGQQARPPRPVPEGRPHPVPGPAAHHRRTTSCEGDFRQREERCNCIMHMRSLEMFDRLRSTEVWRLPLRLGVRTDVAELARVPTACG